MAKPTIISSKETTKVIDENGNEHITTKERTNKIERLGEPDYIKIYTNMWCEFNQIPTQWRNLFLELAIKMTYCNSMDLENSQIVATGGPIKKSICETLNWGDNMYQKGLKALCSCGAIIKKGRGFYQINPNYAARGSWKYNPKYNQGGVEDLVATFSFKDRKVETKIIWADDGSNNDLNELFRQGLQVSPRDETTLKETIIGAINE